MPRLIFLLITLTSAAVLAFPDRVLQTVEGTIKRVVDGDTLVVQTAEGPWKVRLAGVDAPESHDNAKAREDSGKLHVDARCTLEQGQLAGDALRRQVGHRACRLEVVDIDRYRRKVAWVWVDGQLLNEEVVRSGYAGLWLKKGPTPYHERLERARQEASSQHRGLWNLSPCCLPPSR